MHHNKPRNLLFELCTVLLVITVCQRFVKSQPEPISTTTEEQIDILRESGYDTSQLDHSTQLRVLLYTWLKMESAERGQCTPDPRFPMVGKRDKTHHIEKRWATCERFMCPLSGERTICRFQRRCCNGWKDVLGICTRVGWYDGPESKSIKKSMKQLSDTMWFCPQDSSLKLALPGIN